MERREEKGNKSKHGVFKIVLVFLPGSSLPAQILKAPLWSHDLAVTLRGIKGQPGSWVLSLETRMFSEKPWGREENWRVGKVIGIDSALHSCTDGDRRNDDRYRGKHQSHKHDGRCLVLGIGKMWNPS